MIVRTGPLISDARGSCGGVVMSRTRAGNTVRARSCPADHATPRQSMIRARTSVLFDYWSRRLTQAQRDGWNTLGTTTRLPNRVGLDYHPTGQQLFFRCNALRLAASQATIEAAPPYAAVQFPIFTLSHLHAPNRIILVPGTGNWTAVGHLLAWFSNPQSPARSSPPAKFPYLDSRAVAPPAPGFTYPDPTGSTFVTGRLTFARFRFVAGLGDVSQNVIYSELID